MNNVRQRRNKVVILNVEFHNVEKRRNNVVKMTISKKNQNKIASNRTHGIQSFNYYFIIWVKYKRRKKKRRLKKKIVRIKRYAEKIC